MGRSIVIWLIYNKIKAIDAQESAKITDEEKIAEAAAKTDKDIPARLPPESETYLKQSLPRIEFLARSNINTNHFDSKVEYDDNRIKDGNKKIMESADSVSQLTYLTSQSGEQVRHTSLPLVNSPFERLKEDRTFLARVSEARRKEEKQRRSYLK